MLVVNLYQHASRTMAVIPLGKIVYYSYSDLKKNYFKRIENDVCS